MKATLLKAEWEALGRVAGGVTVLLHAEKITVLLMKEWKAIFLVTERKELLLVCG